MCQPMPHNIIKHHKSLNLELTANCNLFGFFEAECYIPDNVKPMLPFKLDNKTIYPHGRWSGVYFTEEMKLLLKYGYKFKLIKGYEFSKVDLFTKYVEYFYKIKSTSSGSTKFIAKMHLNQLYGIFGRKQTIIETVNIYKKDLDKYLSSRIIKTIIDISNEKCCLLLESNINRAILQKLNAELESNFISPQVEIKSNVAIASAVTSYARMIMIPYKSDDHVLYTDTDSIFTSKKLDESLINSKTIGLLKDELSGYRISEAYFLGIKQYGYYYYNSDGNIVNKSTFAGVPKNILSFYEVKAIHEGAIITKNIPTRFFKSFKDLSITIKSNIKMNLSRNNDKVLVGNDYLTIKVNKLTVESLLFIKRT